MHLAVKINLAKLCFVIFLAVAFFAGPAVESGAQVLPHPWPLERHDAQATGRSPFLGPSRPALLWSFPAANDPSPISTPVIDAHGVIYFTAGYGADSKLYALNPGGTVKWVAADMGESPVLGTDGTIYCRSGYDATFRKFCALNPANGEKKWEIQLTITFGNGVSPVVGKDGTIYVNTMAFMYALNPGDGSVKWRLEGITWDGANQLALSPDGTRLYAVTYGYSLFCLSTATGEVFWYKQSPGNDFYYPAVGPDGTVYIVWSGMGYGTRLCAFNPVDGSEKWTLDIGVSGQPVVSGNTILVRGSSRLMVISDQGVELRRIDLPFTPYVEDCPPVADGQGIVYLGTQDKGLFAVNPVTGETKWNLPAGKDGSGAFYQIAIAADGALYVGDNRYLNAVGNSLPYLDCVSYNLNSSVMAATLKYNETAKRTTIEVIDPATNEVVKVFKALGPAYLPTGLAAPLNQPRSGTPRLAVLGINQANQEVLVEVRDGVKGKLIKKIWFDKGYYPKALRTFGLSQQQLAVWQEDYLTGANRLEVRDAATGALVQIIPLP